MLKAMLVDGLEVGRRRADRPTLDQTRGVERGTTAVTRTPRAEEAVGALLGLEAQLGRLGQPRVRGVDIELTVLEPEQVAVRPPGAEHPVDALEVGEDALGRQLDLGTARVEGTHVDAHRHTHDLAHEDAARAGSLHGHLGRVHNPAWSSADWSDSA